MLATRASTATRKAPGFKASRRKRGETNAQWFERQLGELSEPLADGSPPTFVLLTGGRGPYDFRLRIAQSHLRHDLTPSHWSHASLVREVGSPATRTVLAEVSLEPEYGFALPAATNGLQASYLDWYDDPDGTPNIAVLRVPVDGGLWSEVATPEHMPLLEQFAKQRMILDVPGLMLRWLGFVWGVGAEGNPLLSNVGIPSAAAVETLLSAAGFDLSPGLDSRASSPETFWQTASWWHTYYQAQDIPPILGRYHVGHRIDLGEAQHHGAHVGEAPDLGL